jgi:hypothetical protein
VGEAKWAEWHRFDEFVHLGRMAMNDFIGLPTPPPEPTDPEPQPVG